MKFFLSTCILSFFLFIKIQAQDINEISRKMSFPSDLPTPRFIINLPDTANGISIVYEDIKSITSEKLEKLKEIELVELRFSSQLELDREIELLPNFPAMKYLVLGDWKYGSKLTGEEIKIPAILASYKNLKGLKFCGEWKIDYVGGLSVLRQLPGLEYLFFESFKAAIPDGMSELKQLKGISFQSSDFVYFPKWITDLPNLESLGLSMVKYNFKGSEYLNYLEVLSELQKLHLLKSLNISYLNNIRGNFEQIRLNNLENIRLDNVDFKSNPFFINFLTNQNNLQSINITSSSPGVLNESFSKLKKLTDLTITGRNDSLYINFNLKNLSSLKTLKISNTKLFLNQSKLPDNLVRLNLSAINMKVLPNAIFNLTKLKYLTLSYDSLRLLPNEFIRLKQLRYLDLSNNNLKSLPQNFGSLANLEGLNIMANPITELPESIVNLKKLASLNAELCDLNILPSKIGNAVNLKTINISKNLIKTLPVTFTKLNALTSLDISFNQLDKLPADIGNLSNLEILILDFNNIRIIPPSVGKLQKLKKISLSFNDLEHLPIEMQSLKSIEEVSLSTGKITDIKKYNYMRGIYRKDDPNPLKKLTVNNIKNFPEDLNGWKLLKNLNLSNNEEIDTKQLLTGIFSISSKAFSLTLENCGISYLPNEGWEAFYAKSLNLADNQIQNIPKDIVKAPYLSDVNLNRNKLTISPYNLNQYVANQYEKALWFVDLGFITKDYLPKTDSMVLALVNKGSSHYYRKEFKKAVDLTNTAIGINDSLAMSKVFLGNIGEANYEVGNYKAAIAFLSKAIKRDTSGGVRIMNFVIPDFEFRAKSYLKLGDTSSAIQDYKTLAKNFSDNWGDVGILYKTTGKYKEADSAFENGINKYQEQIDYFKKTKQPAEMHQLSLLELMIIKEDFSRAIIYANTLERDFKQIQHITLLRYLKASAEIGNNSFRLKEKSDLLNFIKQNKKSISGWAYDLFFKWLRITKISKDKEKLIREITDQIKP